ncbi:hypothetical protein ANANG_G00140410, partial [Anguilla anguilla]
YRISAPRTERPVGIAVDVYRDWTAFFWTVIVSVSLRDFLVDFTDQRAVYYRSFEFLLNLQDRGRALSVIDQFPDELSVFQLWRQHRVGWFTESIMVAPCF